MMVRKSQVDSDLGRRSEQVEAGSARHSALVAARAFKGSWVRLGEALWKVQQQREYAGWGFKSFTDYCRHELHIREETARKLTRSFAYLADHAPKQLSRAQQGDASPPLDVVDLLRQARGRTQVNHAAFADLEAGALDAEGEPLSRAKLMAKLREADPSAYPAPARPQQVTLAGREPAGGPSLAEGEAEGHAGNDRPVDPQHARKVLLLAERLQALLSEQPSLAKPFRRAALGELVAELREHALGGHASTQAHAADFVKLYPASRID